MSLDFFRRHMNQVEKEKAAKKKGKGKLWEMEEFQLHIGEEAMVRCLPLPEGTDPYVRKFHWPQGSGPKTCTAEIPEFGAKCVYCHYDQEHKAEQQKLAEAARARNEKHDKVASRLNQKTVTVLEVVDFRYYHIVPGEGDEKEVMRCNVEGPEADGERCEFCASEDAAVQARVFGGGRRWQLKDDQLGQLFEAHKRLQKICVHVDEKGKICEKEAYVVEVTCGSCGEALIPSEKVRRMPSKELELALKKEYKCGKCGHEGYADVAAACKSGEHDAVRGSIFDKNLVVTCSGEEKKLAFAKPGEKSTWEDKVLNFDTTACPFESITDSLSNWGFEDEKIEEICKPKDLAWKFRPEFLDPKKYPNPDTYVEAVLNSQAEMLKKPNPFGTTTTTNTGGFRGGGRSFQPRRT